MWFTTSREHIATEIAAAVGLAPHEDLSAVRWIGIRHDDRRIHIVATLARQDRRVAWQDYRPRASLVAG